MAPAFSKVLVANRGEIACRVIAAARARGYATVAVFSAADARARHVALADEAVPIGPAPAAESYLAIERIIAAAKAAGADAVHPGYGFLAENAEFGEACATAGLVFIGPPPRAIRLMGNKAAAKRLMAEAGVPCIAGYHATNQDDATLIAQAARLGFPLMVKAAAGGGGRGMRLVRDAGALAEAIAGSRSEALSAFGSAELILERAVVGARHVEVQVIADSFGQTIHLGERDCSVQRRYQKVIEEAPCPVADHALRAAMGEAAVRAARSVGYLGAGTVEFLLDRQGHFYFLEMNTRIQVEHPVTELVTGLDLVGLQIDIAAGRPLPLAQEQVALTGHAIEARLYAEDPAGGFLPQTGRVLCWEPARGEGVRVDHGLLPGDEIGPHYDAMVAKVIAHGATREEARLRLIRALEETTLLGVPTNKDFLIELLSHPRFARGEAATDFIETAPGQSRRSADSETALARALAAALLVETASVPAGDELRGWWSTGVASAPLRLRVGQAVSALDVQFCGRRYTVGEHGAGQGLTIEIRDCRADGRVSFALGGVVRQARFALDSNVIFLDLGRRVFRFEDVTYAPAAPAQLSSDGLVRAPMSGRVVAIPAAGAAGVAQGDTLVVLEAMKMEHLISAPISGVVEAIAVRLNDQVLPHQLLVTLRPQAAPATDAAP